MHLCPAPPQKIVLVLSAMRHFAAELPARGVRVRYVHLDDPANTQSLRGEVRPGRRARSRTHGGDRAGRMAGARGHARLDGGSLSKSATIHRFLCSIARFPRWASGRNGLRMEFFYRDMRRRTGLLMDGRRAGRARMEFRCGEPQAPAASVDVPPPPRFAPDAITPRGDGAGRAAFPRSFRRARGVRIPGHARRSPAALADFVEHRLAAFGDWQDAMRTASRRCSTR